MSLQDAIAVHRHNTRINVQNPDVLDSIVWSGEKSKRSKTYDCFEFDGENEGNEENSSQYMEIGQPQPVTTESFYTLNKRSRMTSTPSEVHSRKNPNNPKLRPPSTVPQARKQLPSFGDDFDFQKYVVEKLGEITSDKVVQKETVTRLSEKMEDNNKKLVDRLEALEKKIEEREALKPLPQNERKVIVNPKIARHVGKVYGSSATLTFNVEEGFNAPNNKIVRGRLMQELSSKWGVETSDDECHVAVYNRYKNERQKFLSNKNGTSEKLKEMRRKTALKHRKLKGRRRVCKDKEEVDFWSRVETELMSDEERTETLDIVNVVEMPFRSNKLEESIREMDLRRFRGKDIAIKAKVNRGQTKDILKKHYTSDYVI